LFTAGVVAIVIKKEISSKRKSLGILLANGYSKIQIAFSMTSIAFIFIIIPGVSGYIAGYFAQNLFIHIFIDY
jgi:ABC-type antimicrobial peptide transport system permease subunit